MGKGIVDWQRGYDAGMKFRIDYISTLKAENARHVADRNSIRYWAEQLECTCGVGECNRCIIVRLASEALKGGK